MKKLYFNSGKKNSAVLKPFRLFMVVLLICLFGKIETANAANFINKVTNGNWNDVSTWNSSRTGTISSSTSSTTVTGVGTSFTTTLAVGNVLYKNDGITIIGTVASIESNISLTLTANAAVTISSQPYMANSNSVPGANDNVIVVAGSNITLNTSIVIGTGTYTFHGNVTDNGANTLTAITTGGKLQISSNSTTTFGGIAIWSDSTITVDTGSNLITGALTINNKTDIIIDGNLTVNGNVLNSNSNGTFVLKGFVQIIGNYLTNNGNIDVTGSGILQTTGTITTQGNSSEVGGSNNDCNVGPCSSASLGCGTSGISYTSRFTPSNQILCLGQNPSLIAFSTNVPGASLFQWQKSTTNGGSGFVDIPNANSASYIPPAQPSVTTWYRLKYSGTDCTNLLSPSSQITVNSLPVAPILNNVTLNCLDTSFKLGTTTFASGFADYKVDVARDLSFSSKIISDFSLGGPSPAATDITGLAPGGTYYVQVRTVSSSCGTSASSNVATISVPVTTTTDGTTWVNGPPTSNKNAVFMAGGTMEKITTQLNACSCQIDPGVNVVFGVPGETNTDAILKIEYGLDILGNGTLTFENNASLIQVNNNVVNTSLITYKRISQPMKNFDYTYWSSPVSGQTLKNLVPNTDKYYSCAAGSTYWKSENSEGIMDPPGKGYIIRVPKEGEYFAPYPEKVVMPYKEPVEFVGVPNNGHYSLPINGAGQITLIGNPYPSALSANSFLTRNNSHLDGTIYFWTHNTPLKSTGYALADYATYNLTGGTGTTAAAPTPVPGGNPATPSGEIAAGQSFFTVSTGTGPVVFDNDMRIGTSGSNAQFFRGIKSKTVTDERHRLWMNLTNKQGVFKQLLVGYIAGATSGFDWGYDGESIDGNILADFYSICENKNLTIQGRGLPFEEKDQVVLGYRVANAGTFEISIDHVDGSLINQAIFVEDKLTNVIHNLKNGPYSFNTVKGTFNERFVLRYTDKGVNETALDNKDFEKTQKGLVVSVKNHKIKINSFDEIMDNVMVYDLKGSLLFEKKHLNVNEFIIPNFNSSDQFLIVMTHLSNGKWETKEIVF
jgi:hypothetical protein